MSARALQATKLVCADHGTRLHSTMDTDGNGGWVERVRACPECRSRIRFKGAPAEPAPEPYRGAADLLMVPDFSTMVETPRLRILPFADPAPPRKPRRIPRQPVRQPEPRYELRKGVKVRVCRHCAEPLPEQSRGRPAVYCDAHRRPRKRK